MWSAATSHFALSHLRPLGTVDSVCAMGMADNHTVSISTAIQSSHIR
jgi:hypothetical protein